MKNAGSASIVYSCNCPGVAGPVGDRTVGANRSVMWLSDATGAAASKTTVAGVGGYCVLSHSLANRSGTGAKDDATARTAFTLALNRSRLDGSVLFSRCSASGEKAGGVQ